MAGHGSTKADLAGFLISHFSDQNNIRVLSQTGTQHRIEIKMNFFVYLNLGDSGKTILHRILGSNNFHRGIVKFI